MSMQLFLELMAARSNAAVHGVLEEFSLGNALDDVDALPYRYLGDKENNRGPVEAMESTENAVYEKIMNGFDAVIDYRQRAFGFESSPCNAADALAEIGDDLKQPGVYLVTAKADTRRRLTRVPEG